MSRFTLSSVALSLAFSLTCACSGKKKQAEDSDDDGVEELECEDNSDCEQGWVCLAGECSNAGSGAVYSDTKHAVTPDKVRKHLDQVNDKAQKRTDEMLEGL
jgi:hypothetical protein